MSHDYYCRRVNARMHERMQVGKLRAVPPWNSVPSSTGDALRPWGHHSDVQTRGRTENADGAGTHAVGACPHLGANVVRAAECPRFRLGFQNIPYNRPPLTGCRQLAAATDALARGGQPGGDG